jgi:hypothetical protein
LTRTKAFRALQLILNVFIALAFSEQKNNCLRPPDAFGIAPTGRLVSAMMRKPIQIGRAFYIVQNLVFAPTRQPLQHLPNAKPKTPQFIETTITAKPCHQDNHAYFH